MAGTNLARSINVEAELDQIFDRAIDLWDCTSTEEYAELMDLMDLIEKYDRELYPEYWALKDKEKDMAEDQSDNLRSIEDLREYIVETGAQWGPNEPTIMLRLEGLIPLAVDHMLLAECTDDDLCDHGYLGKYRFQEGDFHVICREIRDIE